MRCSGDSVIRVPIRKPGVPGHADRDTKNDTDTDADMIPECMQFGVPVLEINHRLPLTILKRSAGSL
jgi:hypothetical protein